MAWKVASDGEVLDIHVQAEKDCTRQDKPLTSGWDAAGPDGSMVAADGSMAAIDG